jgi:hypothetical protein
VAALGLDAGINYRENDVVAEVRRLTDAHLPGAAPWPSRQAELWDRAAGAAPERC